MGQYGTVLAAPACRQCESESARLYRLPPTRLLGDRAPRAVCHFCYIRIAGIRPTKSMLVADPGPPVSL